MPVRKSSGYKRSHTSTSTYTPGTRTVTGPKGTTTYTATPTTTSHTSVTVVPPNKTTYGNTQPVVLGGGGNGNLVSTLLLFLIIANGFSSKQFQQLWGVVTGKTSDLPSGLHNYAVMVGAELLFLIAMSMIAESSPGANKVALTLVIALWIVWFYHNRSILEGLNARLSGKETSNQPSKKS